MVLLRDIQKTYGISSNKYINQLKINKAKSLMLYSNLNVSEIESVFIPATGYEHQEKLRTSGKKTVLQQNSPA